MVYLFFVHTTNVYSVSVACQIPLKCGYTFSMRKIVTSVSFWPLKISVKKMSKRSCRKTSLSREQEYADNFQLAHSLHGYSKGTEDTVASNARQRTGLSEVSAEKSQVLAPIGYEQGFVTVTDADCEGTSPKMQLMLCSAEQRKGQNSSL